MKEDLERFKVAKARKEPVIESAKTFSEGMKSLFGRVLGGGGATGGVRETGVLPCAASREIIGTWFERLLAAGIVGTLNECKPESFLIARLSHLRNQSLLFLCRKGAETYPSRVWPVSGSCLVRIKVPLYGENTERVRNRYGLEPCSASFSSGIRTAAGSVNELREKEVCQNKKYVLTLPPSSIFRKYP